MNDPVKGEGRIITDASGVTRREGGILGMWSNIFPERNGSNEQKGDSASRIPDIRDILDVFPQPPREKLLNKISEAIDYEPAIGVAGETGAGKAAYVMHCLKGGFVQLVTLRYVLVKFRNCICASEDIR